MNSGRCVGHRPDLRTAILARARARSTRNHRRKHSILTWHSCTHQSAGELARRINRNDAVGGAVDQGDRGQHRVCFVRRTHAVQASTLDEVGGTVCASTDGCERRVRAVNTLQPTHALAGRRRPGAQRARGHSRVAGSSASMVWNTAVGDTWRKSSWAHAMDGAIGDMEATPSSRPYLRPASHL